MREALARSAGKERSDDKRAKLESHERSSVLAHAGPLRQLSKKNGEGTFHYFACACQTARSTMQLTEFG